MKRLPVFILVFSIAFAVFFMAPPLLSRQFDLYPLIRTGDVLDMLTPLILIPLYWRLYRMDKSKAVSLAESLAFLVLAAFWVEGQGMHLASNSIGHLLKGTTASDVHELANFYDEVLSHYLWHFGIVGLSALLVFRQWRNPFSEEQIALWPLFLSGFIHGFTLFAIVIEGETAPLGVPFVILIALFGLIWGRRKLREQPLLLFFLISCLVAVALFAGWGIYWRGLPEFSQVGIID